jgi:hypothetical protein
MEIKLAHLLVIMDRLVESYIERGISAVEVDGMDEYWQASAPEWTDFTKQPELSVGSLSDDWEALKKVLDGEEIPTANDFDRLATLLHVVSEQIAGARE